MKKSSSKSQSFPRPVSGEPVFKDHDIAGTNPLVNQFEPTPEQPIRQHAQMAGDPCGYKK